MSKQDLIGKELTDGDDGPAIGKVLEVLENGNLVVRIYGQPGTFILADLP